MKKFFAGIVKLITVLTVLGAIAYAVVTYWDRIEAFFDRLKALCAEKGACRCHREEDDYADWDE